MSIIDVLTEESFIQMLKDIRELSDEEFGETLNCIETGGELPKKETEDYRQLQLVLMKTIDNNNSNN